MRHDLFFCAWCGIEMKWWRPFLGRNFCRDCADPSLSYLTQEARPFHSRVGEKE